MGSRVGECFMRYAREVCLDRGARRRVSFDSSGPFDARHRNWRRVGAGAIARIIRSRTGRQQQCGWLHGDAGLSRQPGARSFVLAARGYGGATGPSLSARIGGDRNRSGTHCVGRFARSGNAATHGGRRGSLRFGGRRGDRSVAQPARARPDCKSAFGAGGKSVRRHHLASPCRSGARAQRGPDTLERSRRAFHSIGGWSARSAFFHHQIVASAWPSGWWHLASGMGS